MNPTQVINHDSDSMTLHSQAEQTKAADAVTIKRVFGFSTAVIVVATIIIIAAISAVV